MKRKIRKLLNFKLLLFMGISFSIIGFIQVLASVLLVNSFPIELIEIDLINKIPVSPLLVPLLFWNLPLILAIAFKVIFKEKK